MAFKIYGRATWIKDIICPMEKRDCLRLGKSRSKQTSFFFCHEQNVALFLRLLEIKKILIEVAYMTIFN